jgi:hypothetical protein
MAFRLILTAYALREGWIIFVQIMPFTGNILLYKRAQYFSFRGFCLALAQIQKTHI